MAFLTFGTSCTWAHGPWLMCGRDPWHRWTEDTCGWNNKYASWRCWDSLFLWFKQRESPNLSWGKKNFNSISYFPKSYFSFLLHLLGPFERSHLPPFPSTLLACMSCLLAVCHSICPQPALLTSVRVWVNTCWACMRSFWIGQLELLSCTRISARLEYVISEMAPMHWCEKIAFWRGILSCDPCWQIKAYNEYRYKKQIIRMKSKI